MRFLKNEDYENRKHHVNSGKLDDKLQTIAMIFLFIFFHILSVQRLHNLRERPAISKPDAANPRQVDAVVMPLIYQNVIAIPTAISAPTMPVRTTCQSEDMNKFVPKNRIVKKRIRTKAPSIDAQAISHPNLNRPSLFNNMNVGTPKRSIAK